MPWIIPSHQAPILALKSWRPRFFSGLGLFLGSVAPDLEFILRLDRFWIVSHTLAGQLLFTVPCVLLLHALATHLVLPWLVPYLPTGPPLYFDVLGRFRPAADGRDWAKIAGSGLVGGLTHIGLDGFTHGDHSGWAAVHLPALRRLVPHPGGAIPLHDALQIWLTIVLGVTALRSWQRIARAGGAPRPWRGQPFRLVTVPPAPCPALWSWLAAMTLAGAVLRFGAGSLEPRPGIELGAYGSLEFFALALVLGAVADRLRRSLRALQRAVVPRWVRMEGEGFVPP